VHYDVLQILVDDRTTTHHDALHRMSDSTLKNRTVRLSDQQLASVKTVAKEQKRKYTEVIRIAVDEFLERNKPTNKKAAAV